MPKNPRDLRSNNGASIVTFTHSISSITGSTNGRTAASLWKYASSTRWSMYSDGSGRARERFFTSFHSGPFVRSLALPLSRLPESHFAFLHGSNFKSSSIFIRYFWERRRRPFNSISRKIYGGEAKRLLTYSIALIRRLTHF